MADVPVWVEPLINLLTRTVPNALKVCSETSSPIHAFYGPGSDPMYVGAESGYGSWAVHPRGLELVAGVTPLVSASLASLSMSLTIAGTSFTVSNAETSPFTKDGSRNVGGFSAQAIESIVGVTINDLADLVERLLPTPQVGGNWYAIPDSESINIVVRAFCDALGVTRAPDLPILCRAQNGYQFGNVAYPGYTTLKIVTGGGGSGFLVPLMPTGTPMGFTLSGSGGYNVRKIYDPRFGAPTVLDQKGLTGYFPVVVMADANTGIAYSDMEKGVLQVGGSPSYTVGSTYSGTFLKRSCLPLVATPNVPEYTLSATSATVESYELTVGSNKLMLYAHASALTTEYYAVNKSWYNEYLSTGWGALSPLTGEKLEASLAKWPTGLDGYLTVVRYPTVIGVPRDIIARTDIYKEYEKACDKACLTNDFYEQPYSGDFTWGAARSAIAETPLGWSSFYGHRQEGTVSSTIALPERVKYAVAYSESEKKFSTTDDTAAVIAMTPQQAFENWALGAPYGAGLGDGNYAAAFAATEAATAQEVTEGAKVRQSLLAAATTYATYVGTGKDTFSFQEDAISNSGYVDYTKLPVQAAYKGAIRSGSLLYKVGTSVVKIIDEYRGLVAKTTASTETAV